MRFSGNTTTVPERMVREADAEGRHMLPEEMRRELRLGTSSSWAADLSEDDLRAVLWMVGEFGRRAPYVLAALEQHWAETPPRDRVASSRAKLALEGLFRVV